MFIDIDQAIYDRMANDAELVAMIETYTPNGSLISAGDSGVPSPAIFTDREVPEDARLPYIWTHGQITDIDDDTKLQPGRDIVREIQCFTLRNQTDTIERIGQRIRDLFHRRTLPILDALAIVSEASGPIATPTDETVLGRSVTVRLRYETINGGSSA